MLLGVLVALVKIAELATVVPGMALFALGGAGLPAGRDAGELRPARGLGSHRVGRRRGARGPRSRRPPEATP